jgi:hypothetical protein
MAGSTRMVATMMDAHEAIKGLDGYAETLLGLSTLLNAGFCEEKSDQHEALLAQIKQNQTDGRWIANEIMKDLHGVGAKADRSGDLTGISAAMQRYVAADNQATEALKKADKAATPNPTSEAIRRFRESRCLTSERLV